MDDFSIAPGTPNAFGLVGNAQNAVAPGKRPLSSMSPTVVLEGDAVKMVVGGAGGPTIISGTLQVLLNVLDGKLDAQAASAAPRIHHQWQPDDAGATRPTSPATWSRAWSAGATRPSPATHHARAGQRHRAHRRRAGGGRRVPQRRRARWVLSERHEPADPSARS